MANTWDSHITDFYPHSVPQYPGDGLQYSTTDQQDQVDDLDQFDDRDLSAYPLSEWYSENARQNGSSSAMPPAHLPGRNRVPRHPPPGPASTNARPPLPQNTVPGVGRRVMSRKVRLARSSVLSIDYLVPTPIRAALQSKYRDNDAEHKEFSTLRYTAVTVDPKDFTLKNGYDLRPRMFQRHTEHLVCVTYYNEDKTLLSRTLHSLFENFRDTCNLKTSTFWSLGGPAWQKMVVCIVMDGMEACDKRVLDVLAVMGVYQEGIMVKDVEGAPVTAHLFECTTQLSVTSDQRLVQPQDDSPDTLAPVQLMLCLKTQNAGKINSYRWIYNAFGRILNPEIVVNVDTGTYLEEGALVRLWASFYNDRNLGASCGALHADLGRRYRDLLNPLVATQNFEYKVAVQLDRAMEGATGYLSVLPGAFSGYRFRAVMGRPLEAYFIGDPTLRKLPAETTDSIYRLNRFLADDRILAFELVLKRGQKWHTDMVSGARAYTDIPTNTTDFITQRRRWLNGSFAAALYSLRMVVMLPMSGHNIIRLFFLFLQLVHNVTALLVAWFSLSGFLLTTFIVNEVTGDPPDAAPVEGFPFGASTPIVNAVIQVVYICTLVFQFILALGSRPKSSAVSYVISFSIFAFVQLYLVMNLVYLTKRLVDFQLDTNGGSKYAFINEYYADVGYITILVTAISIFGSYIVAGILALDPWHLVTSWAQFLFISSSYINILNIYAFSNIHDVSWGRKSGKKEPERVPTWDVTVQRTDQGQSEAIVADRPMQDIDKAFKAALKRAVEPHVPEKEPEQDDTAGRFMKFRTMLVAVYIFSNFLVCVVVLDQTFSRFQFGDPYWKKIWFFRVWMWANASLFILKGAGMVWYRMRCVYQFFFYVN